MKIISFFLSSFTLLQLFSYVIILEGNEKGKKKKKKIGSSSLIEYLPLSALPLLTIPRYSHSESPSEDDQSSLSNLSPSSWPPLLECKCCN
jgi:hypothetical protein